MQEFQGSNNKMPERKEKGNHQRNNSKFFSRTKDDEFLDWKGQIMSNKTDKIYPNQGTSTWKLRTIGKKRRSCKLPGSYK